MAKKKDSGLKAGLITWAVFMALFIVAMLYVTNNNHYEVKHYPKVEQTVSADGRYVAGSDEFYTVDISPALIWEIGKGKEWRVVFFIVMGLVAVFMALQATGSLPIDKPAPFIFVGIAVAAACLLAAYSSQLVSNTSKPLTPAEYNQLKDDKVAIEQLFTSKPVVR